MSSLFNVGVFNLGVTELIIILVIVMLLFGVGRIRSLMREMGGGISEFKKGMREADQPDPPKTTETSIKDPGKVNHN